MGPGRPRTFESAEVLEAAMELFWPHGYERTSKRDLMEATGLASQSLYNAFGDKHGLFMACVRYYLETKLSTTMSELQAEGSPLENLKRVLTGWVDSCDKGCMLINTAAEFGQEDPELAEFLRGCMAQGQAAYADVLRRAHAAGEIAQELDPDAVAAALFSMGSGLTLMKRLGATDAEVEGSVQGFLKLLER